MFIYVIILGYAIHKYKFLDIEVIIKRTLVFAGLFGMAMAVVGVVTTMMQQLIGLYLPVHPFFFSALSVFAAILLYDPTKKWLINLTENVLFQRDIDYGRIDQDIADQIQITELATQLRNIVEIFRSGFLLESAAIFLWDEEKKAFHLAHQAGLAAPAGKAEIPAQDPGLSVLKSYPESVLVRSALFAKGDTGAMNFLSQWKAEVACKISFKESLIAILLLGKKKSDKDFDPKDIDFLEKVSKNLAVSIQNAMTFKFKEDYYVLMAEKNKTDVLARLSEGIDHEIKNPLNAIKPAAQRLQAVLSKVKIEDPEALSKMSDYLQMILRNSDRIVGIMTRLRNFARPIRTSEGIKLEPMLLREVIDEAIELISQKQLEVDGVVVENRVSKEMRIFGDHASLVQVFWNLIVNAYHAIDRNGQIDISARPSPMDGRVVVEVRDNGRGIAPEHLEKVFTPFFTTKPTNISPEGNERFTGTGLGLCYVKQYVEGLGGSIACQSKSGEGTVFYLKFLRANGRN